MALRDITLGQYFPGNTIVHRLDPRTKLLCTILYIISLFLARGPVGYAVLFLVLASCTAAAKIRPAALFRGMRPILFIIVLTAVLNVFYTPGTVLWQWRFLRVTVEGLWAAFFMVLRITFLISSTFLLTYTTSPILLTDGLEKLLGPLKRIHVPVHELSMIMSIALRFIPTLIEETDKIMKAQMSRGVDFESGNILERGKKLIPVLVPLFIAAIRRASDLAMAMDARCYNGGEGKTRLHPLIYEKRDYIAYGIMLLYVVIMIFCSFILKRFF